MSPLRALACGIAGFVIAANIGVCVWAVVENKPHAFLTSAAVSVLLFFQVASMANRRKP